MASQEEPAVYKLGFTQSEFTKVYGISRTRLYREIKAERLIARRLGGRMMITRADADAWQAALPTYRSQLAAHTNLPATSQRIPKSRYCCKT